MTDTAQQLTEIWRDHLQGEAEQALSEAGVLAVGEVRPKTLMKVLAAIRVHFAVSLTVPELLAAPSMAEQARIVDRKRASSGTIEVVRSASGGLIKPMTRLHEVWLDHALRGRIPPQWPLLFMCLNIEGPLVVPALEAAFEELSRRHETLRSRIIRQGDRLFYEVLETPLPLLHHGGGSIVAHMAEAAVHAEEGPLLQATLLPDGKDRHQLLFVVHHCIFDHGSNQIVLRDLAEIYSARVEGRDPMLPPVTQYGDWVLSRHALLGPAGFARQESWWAQYLDGASLDFDLDAPRTQPCGPAANVNIALSREQTEGVRSLCRRWHVSPFVVFVGAHKISLSRLSGERDISLVHPASIRSAGTQHAIGPLFNMHALRSQLDPKQPFQELISEMQQRVLAGMSYSDVTIDAVLPQFKGESWISVEANYLQGTDVAQFKDLKVTLDADRLGSTAELVKRNDDDGTSVASINHQSLILQISDYGGTIGLRQVYREDLCQRATAERILEGTVAVLASALSDPGQSLQSLPGPPMR